MSSYLSFSPEFIYFSLIQRLPRKPKSFEKCSETQPRSKEPPASIRCNKVLDVKVCLLGFCLRHRMVKTMWGVRYGVCSVNCSAEFHTGWQPLVTSTLEKVFHSLSQQTLMPSWCQMGMPRKQVESTASHQQAGMLLIFLGGWCKQTSLPCRKSQEQNYFSSSNNSIWCFQVWQRHSLCLEPPSSSFPRKF